MQAGTFVELDEAFAEKVEEEEVPWFPQNYETCMNVFRNLLGLFRNLLSMRNKPKRAADIESQVMRNEPTPAADIQSQVTRETIIRRLADSKKE
ncbi:unnamed protein product [Camellia sinensis]